MSFYFWYIDCVWELTKNWWHRGSLTKGEAGIVLAYHSDDTIKRACADYPQRADVINTMDTIDGKSSEKRRTWLSVCHVLLQIAWLQPLNLTMPVTVSSWNYWKKHYSNRQAQIKICENRKHRFLTLLWYLERWRRIYRCQSLPCSPESPLT